MSFTLSGLFLLLLALYVFLRKPTKLSYYVVFFAPFSATAIVNFTALGYKSGGVGMTPAIAFLLLFLVAQVLYGHAFQPVRVSRSHLLQLVLIGAFSLECIASLLFNTALRGVTSFQITQTIYLFIGIVATITLSFEFARDGGVEGAVGALRASAIFVSLWGLLQYVCYTVDLPYPSILFNNSLSDFAYMFDQNSGGFMRLASVAVEPSFFAAAMLHFGVFGATALMYEPRLRTWQWVWPVGLTLGTLVLSTSTTAYVGIFILALLLLVERPRAMLLAGIPTAGAIVLAIVMAPKLRDAILIMTIEKGSSGSYADRTERMFQALRMFPEAPFFGHGWSASPNFNALTALLANVGIVGTVLALAAGIAIVLELGLSRSGLANGPDWKLAAYAVGAQNTLIVSFTCAVTSGLKYVVLDDACFWAISIALTSRLAKTRCTAATAQHKSVATEYTMAHSEEDGHNVVERIP